MGQPSTPAGSDHLNVHLKGKERLSLFSDLSTMLSAGIPILEAVESLQEDVGGSLKKVLAVLHANLVNGEPLSQGLERMPQAFDPISVNLIRAAEAGGTLEETLHDIVQTTKKELAFSDQLRNTMIYPLFVMGVFMAIVVLMLTFVIPRVAKVFATMRVHQPLVTRGMIAASKAFNDHWIIISVVFVALLIGFVGFVKVNSRPIARALLSLPGLKVLGTNIDLTRFTRSFGLLMHAGVPVVEALELSEKVVRKKQLIELVQGMEHNVANGKPLSTGLRAHVGHKKSLVPPIMSRSIETAEESGTLEQTMQNLTEYFDDQVAGSVKVVSSLIEPILLVMVGVMVGALMITIIAPIYNLISQINPKS